MSTSGVVGLAMRRLWSLLSPGLKAFRPLLAATILAASVLGIPAIVAGASPGDRVGVGARLLPDLAPLGLASSDLVMVRINGRISLRFATEVANQGSGPLEIVPSEQSSDCDGDGDPTDDRDALQQVYVDGNGSGSFEPGLDPAPYAHAVGCMRFHAVHGHWHLLNFTTYQLLDDAGEQLVSRTRKMGFCLRDDRPVAEPPAGVPPTAVYPLDPSSPMAAPESIDCGATTTQGISVGYADLYGFDVPGQRLDVSRVRRGRYCLRSTVDPLELIDEGDNADNSVEVPIAIRPHQRRVRKLDGLCR